MVRALLRLLQICERTQTSNVTELPKSETELSPEPDQHRVCRQRWAANATTV